MKQKRKSMEIWGEEKGTLGLMKTDDYTSVD